MLDRTFGIEFEITDALSSRALEDALNSARLSHLVVNRVSDEEDDDPYAKSDGSSWEIKLDCSCGMEICTPALRLADWTQVSRALSALWNAGARTSRACSAHVHVDVSQFEVSQLRTLAVIWEKLEPSIFKLLAPSRTENSFCIPLAWQSLTGLHDYREFRTAVEDSGRYLALNMTGWWYHGRVEFRAHHGTLRQADIRAWVEFLLTLVTAAATMSKASLHTWLAKSEDEALAAVVTTYGPEGLLEILQGLAARRNPSLVSA